MCILCWVVSTKILNLRTNKNFFPKYPGIHLLKLHFMIFKRYWQHFYFLLDLISKCLQTPQKCTNKQKNYETHYRSARVQVWTISKYIWTILNNFLGLSCSILLYLGLYWSIMDYLGLSWCILLYLILSRSISVYLGLF